MCLTIPMKVTEIDGLNATCEALGTTRSASLLLMMEEPPEVGDWVLISLGQVQRVVPEDEAREALALFQEISNALPA